MEESIWYGRSLKMGYERKNQTVSEIVLEELIDQYQADAYRYSIMLMGNREDAWDILQESWIQVYKKYHTLKDQSCFKSWFYQILTRNGWKMKKKGNREVPVEDIFENFRPGLEKSMEEKAVQSERNQFLLKQIYALNPKLKSAVLLYYYSKFSVEEIAKITGSLPATVKSRLYQARKQLKKALEQDEETWK